MCFRILRGDVEALVWYKRQVAFPEFTYVRKAIPTQPDHTFWRKHGTRISATARLGVSYCPSINSSTVASAIGFLL